jgi:hypothetical protein
MKIIIVNIFAEANIDKPNTKKPTEISTIIDIIPKKEPNSVYENINVIILVGVSKIDSRVPDIISDLNDVAVDDIICQRNPHPIVPTIIYEI